MREGLEENDGVSIGGTRISNLRYADDPVLTAEDANKLQSMVKRVSSISKQYGLLLNTNKTKVLVTGKTPSTIVITVDGQVLEQVKHDTYLGSEITENCDSETDIRKRLAMARSTLMNTKHIWYDRDVSRCTKIRLLQALIWSIATYGAETWTLKRNDEKRIEAFEMWCYRRLLRVSYREHRTNEWILQKLGTERQLLKQVKKRKLRFFGHIKRHPGSLEEIIMEGQVDGKRSAGRPRITWEDNIKTWSGMRSITIAGALAQDRSRWRAVVNALSSV